MCIMGWLLSAYETKESTLELFRNLITLDIPYIYDTSISDFSKITVNNIDSLKNFKRLFKKEILNIDFTKEKEKLILNIL